MHTRTAARARQIGRSGAPGNPVAPAQLTVWIGGEATNIEVKYNAAAAIIRFDGRDIDIATDVLKESVKIPGASKGDTHGWDVIVSIIGVRRKHAARRINELDQGVEESIQVGNCVVWNPRIWIFNYA